MNNRLLLMVNPKNMLLVEPQILMILIPIQLLAYLILCLYHIIKDSKDDNGIVHTNTTSNTLIYLFLLFQCYVAMMYGIAALMILVIITTMLLLLYCGKKKHSNSLSKILHSDHLL